MDFECPNCGSFETAIDEDQVTFFQGILALLSLGLYNPWKKASRESIRKFELGINEAECLVCCHRFRVFEKIDLKRIQENRIIRLEGESSLAFEKEREKEILNELPPKNRSTI